MWAGSQTDGPRYLAGHDAYKGAERVHFEGNHYRIEGGASFPAPVQKPHPPLYFGGSSPAGKRTAVETADVYLMWAEPLDWIGEQIAEMERLRRELKREKGIDRPLRYGLRAQVLVRETEEEAWNEARAIVSKIDREALEQSQQRFSGTDATNQKRQNELRERSRANDYVVGPNLWAGLSLVRGGGSMLLVGTPEQLSDRLLEFVDVGISSFILSGYPNLEEAEITGELLLPLVKRKLAERRRDAAVGT